MPHRRPRRTPLLGAALAASLALGPGELRLTGG